MRLRADRLGLLGAVLAILVPLLLRSFDETPPPTRYHHPAAEPNPRQSRSRRPDPPTSAHWRSNDHG